MSVNEHLFASPILEDQVLPVKREYEQLFAFFFWRPYNEGVKEVSGPCRHSQTGRSKY
jgi:hypothetical protein